MLFDVWCINRPIVKRPLYLIIVFKVDSIDFLEKCTAVLHWIFFLVTTNAKFVVTKRQMQNVIKKTKKKEKRKPNKQTNKDCKNDF